MVGKHVMMALKDYLTNSLLLDLQYRGQNAHRNEKHEVGRAQPNIAEVLVTKRVRIQLR